MRVGNRKQSLSLQMRVLLDYINYVTIYWA